LKLTNGEIVMDEKGSSVLLKRKGQALDFGGIAKGYAMDQLIRLFEENGVKNVLINLGGTVCSVGKERSIGIRDPFTPANRNAPQRIVASISSQDEIFVTSGTYEQGLHIVDPVKGRLAQTELLAVTVIGRNGVHGARTEKER
jgi:thiamine biosynthesis lipoprotein